MDNAQSMPASDVQSVLQRGTASEPRLWLLLRPVLPQCLLALLFRLIV